MSVEVVEVDFRGFQYPPPDVESDMLRCDVLWVPHPKIPKNPSIGSLQWGWGWRDWKWEKQPCIPKQAIFEETVEIHETSADGLYGKAESKLNEIILSRPKNATFALFLRVGEKYIQGIEPGKPGFQAYLTRCYVLMGLKGS